MKIIVGPCVIESRDLVMRIAEALKPTSELNGVDFFFKSSFDKANRTSIDVFRGLGIEKGLKILQEVKKESGFKLLTDVHETCQVKQAAEVVDILQIPAFLCRQTDLIVEAAKTKKIINIKKGQFMDGHSMQYSVKKVLQTRHVQQEGHETACENGVWLCERGNSFGYGNLVVDMRNLVIMRKIAPVIFDCTHSVQMPSIGGKTGGDRTMVPFLAKAAAAVGVDGFFIEAHTNPDKAKSDAANMLFVNDVQPLVEKLLHINEVQQS